MSIKFRVVLYCLCYGWVIQLYFNTDEETTTLAPHHSYNSLTGKNVHTDMLHHHKAALQMFMSNLCVFPCIHTSQHKYVSCQKGEHRKESVNKISMLNLSTNKSRSPVRPRRREGFQPRYDTILEHVRTWMHPQYLLCRQQMSSQDVFVHCQTRLLCEPK